MKFRKGDIVRGLKHNGYGLTNEEMTKGEVVKANREMMTVRILEHPNSLFIGTAYDVVNDDRRFKPADKDCIVIYRKNNEVIALDKTTKERAVAKCSPEDEFDFKLGAKIAFGRLMVGDIKPHETSAMKPHEAAAWFREELKGGKCSENCVQCNANEEEIQHLLKAWEENETAISYVAEIGGVDRLRELAQADKSGRLVVLPCKEGDFVYALWDVPTEYKYVIYYSEVKEARFSMRNSRLTTTYLMEPIEFRGRRRAYRDDEFGKTVFFTREEAEAALKGDADNA